MNTRAALPLLIGLGLVIFACGLPQADAAQGKQMQQLQKKMQERGEKALQQLLELDKREKAERAKNAVKPSKAVTWPPGTYILPCRYRHKDHEKDTHIGDRGFTVTTVSVLFSPNEKVVPYDPITGKGDLLTAIGPLSHPGVYPPKCKPITVVKLTQFVIYTETDRLDWVWKCTFPNIPADKCPWMTKIESPLKVTLKGTRVTIAKNAKPPPAPAKKHPPSIEIVYPDKSDIAKRQFTFDDANPATLKIYAEAKVSGDADSDKVTWKLEKIGNASVDIEPKHGNIVDITIKGLTNWNAQMGKKKLTASVAGKSDSTTIEVFFPPMATNHPGPRAGKTPNWFYYWAQTQAGRGYSPEYRDKPLCTKGALGNYYYRYDKIFLYKNTYKGICMNRMNGDTATGFDCYAETLRHEDVHQQELHEWWDHVPGVAGAFVKKYLRLAGPTECVAPLVDQANKLFWNKVLSIDSDEDLVPNYIENNIAGCDAHNPISCPGIPPQVIAKGKQIGKRALDVEMDSYRISWKQWPLHHDDKEDWSWCGKQWKDPSVCPGQKIR